MDRKVVFLIPGFNESIDQDRYKSLPGLFKSSGIEPIAVPIKWPRNIISQNLQEFLKIYQETEADKKYVLGFSYGATIAFLAATQVSFEAIILCSLSPYFQEDLPHIPKYWKTSIGKRRVEDFQKMNSVELAKKITSPIYIIHGTEEGSEVENTTNRVFRSLSNPKELILVPGAKHDVGDSRYVEEVRKLIEKL